ncbi:hypothetical protein [Methylicorpusculum sp.]|uniref:hypothetical protein n=1 Tax=Methylicorpusculum sp. TaxID=2713644 RepID=UPI002722B4C5|nr:hypothetical protein [Methylicorpusculum sp.]MDO8845086.1 hypothetical protein [Methylicorpusculum sp.]MDP2179219.1 hypothetical protein [Methylicorpusculum sp.]MDP3528065.1 hypothetical protein [Methylicorpusculum sp.]MDZ4152733.1 hypothetical protein [Methylicorpusculum sp.]
MTALQLFEESVLFAPNIPEAVNQILQAAVTASHDDAVTAERLFIEARKLDSHCLQTYFALYKFYFYRARLGEAELTVLAALEEAARQGRFPSDYKRLVREKETWDLYSSEVAHFYLYSLKALAFIKLRSGQAIEARVILSCLHELDPEDRAGSSVISDLASALEIE